MLAFAVHDNANIKEDSSFEKWKSKIFLNNSIQFLRGYEPNLHKILFELNFEDSFVFMGLRKMKNTSF